MEHIAINDAIRVDDFCVLSVGSDGIDITNYPRAVVYLSRIGSGCIDSNDFYNARIRVLNDSNSEDYSVALMPSLMVPETFTVVHHDKVAVGVYMVIGNARSALPGVRLRDQYYGLSAQPRKLKLPQVRSLRRCACQDYV